MTIKTYREAVKEALAQEMERDERVVLIGEDLRGGHGGNAPEEAKIEAFGGVLGVTKGLWTQFGSDRVIDTPITESAIIGMAAGAAATGLRPVAELMFMDFFGVSHDALYNQAAEVPLHVWWQSQSSAGDARDDRRGVFCRSPAFTVTL